MNYIYKYENLKPNLSRIPYDRNPENDSPKQLEVISGKIKEISVNITQTILHFCGEMRRK